MVRLDNILPPRTFNFPLPPLERLRFTDSYWSNTSTIACLNSFFSSRPRTIWYRSTQKKDSRSSDIWCGVDRGSSKRATDMNCHVPWARINFSIKQMTSTSITYRARMSSRLRIHIFLHLLRQVPIYQNAATTIRDKDVARAHIPV